MAATTVPDLVLEGTAGPRRLRPSSGRRLLLLLYQEDGTPTCTTQLRSFQQDFEALAELHAEVVGISPDDVRSHRAFVDRLGGLPFPLLSDPGGDLARALGAWDADNARTVRSVFVVDEQGNIVHASLHYNPGNLSQYEAIFHALGLNL